MQAVGHPAESWVGPYFSRRVMELGNGWAYQVTLGKHTKEHLYWLVLLVLILFVLKIASVTLSGLGYSKLL